MIMGTSDRWTGRMIPVILCLVMALAVLPVISYAGQVQDGQKGEVIVMFKDGAVGEDDTSLKAAKAIP